MKWIYFILVAAALILAYRYSWVLGIAVSIVLVLYGIYYYLPQIYRVKGRQYFNEGNYHAAKRMFKKAVDTGHAKGDIRMEYSYILLRTGDIDEAEQVVNNMLCYKIKPEYRGRAIIQRCMCYYKKGNLDEAIEDGMELFNEGYRSIMLYGMLGFFKILKDPMSQDTFDFCLEAYDYADDDRDIRDNLLICYYNRGEYEKAKEISDKVLEKNPKFVEAWYHGAQVDYKLGNYEDALKKLDKTAECNRSFMTTIPELDIMKLREEIKATMRGKGIASPALDGPEQETEETSD